MIRTDIENLKPNENYAYPYYTIYSLVNLYNGKRYIGRTRNLGRRIKQHFINIKNHKHPNGLLNEDCDCPFGFEILEENISFDKRKEKEKHYILLYETFDKSKGYNGNDPCLGRVKHAKSISNQAG